MNDYKRVQKILNNDNSNINPECISIADLLDVYYSNYNLGKRKESPLFINGFDNEATKCTLAWYPNQLVIASISKNDKDGVLDIYFDCSKLTNIYVINSNYEAANYTLEQVEKYKTLLISRVQDYAKEITEFYRNFDSSHRGMKSTDSAFCLYLVDKEAIVFFPHNTYIDILTNEDESINYDLHNLNSDIRSLLEEKYMEFFSKVYVYIADAPAFLHEDLYKKRNEELANINKLDYSRKRVLKRFNKKGEK